jgi:hypothetical protein
MSVSRRDEERFLADDERELVAYSRAEAIKSLSDDDLKSIVTRLRERRRRARDISARQRREMRGKSEPAGTRAAKGNTGTELKAEALTAALKRANKELARRRAASDVPDQVAIARKALKAKREADKRANPRPSSRTRGSGMRLNENQKAEDLTVRSEVGRVTKFVAVAQAKRDARG